VWPSLTTMVCLARLHILTGRIPMGLFLGPSRGGPAVGPARLHNTNPGRMIRGADQKFGTEGRPGGLVFLSVYRDMNSDGNNGQFGSSSSTAAIMTIFFFFFLWAGLSDSSPSGYPSPFPGFEGLKG